MKSKEEIQKLSYKYSDKVNMFNDWTSHSIADAVTYGYTQCQKDMAEKIEVNSPNPKLIDSMAMRYRHDFGLLDKQQQDSIRTTMIQLWEEVVGKGFY
jgi:hypothetical protein